MQIIGDESVEKIPLLLEEEMLIGLLKDIPMTGVSRNQTVGNEIKNSVVDGTVKEEDVIIVLEVEEVGGRRGREVMIDFGEMIEEVKEMTKRVMEDVKMISEIVSLIDIVAEILIVMKEDETGIDILTEIQTDTGTETKTGIAAGTLIAIGIWINTVKGIPIGIETQTDTGTETETEEEEENGGVPLLTEETWMTDLEEDMIVLQEEMKDGRETHGWKGENSHLQGEGKKDLIVPHEWGGGMYLQGREEMKGVRMMVGRK